MFATRVSPIRFLENYGRFKLKPKRVTKGGLNFHRSNKAKEGLYHGKDVQFGHSISHSRTKSKKKWLPNVINKRVWSDALDDWVRFKMTTRTLKEIDDIGGIDNYMLNLDEVSVTDSFHNSRVRDLIASTLFHRGQLAEKLVKRLKYDTIPPPLPEIIKETRFAKPERVVDKRAQKISIV